MFKVNSSKLILWSQITNRSCRFWRSSGSTFAPWFWLVGPATVAVVVGQITSSRAVWINFHDSYLLESAPFSYLHSFSSQRTSSPNVLPQKMFNFKLSEWLCNFYIKRKGTLAFFEVPGSVVPPQIFPSYNSPTSCVTMKHGMSWVVASPRPGCILWRRQRWRNWMLHVFFQHNILGISTQIPTNSQIIIHSFFFTPQTKVNIFQ